MRYLSSFAAIVVLISTPALADNLSFNACGTGWKYIAKGNNPTVEWFETDLEGGGDAISLRLSPSVTAPSLSGQDGIFDLDLPIQSLPGLQATIAQKHYFYVALNYHAGTGGNSSSQVLDNFVVSDTNGQPTGHPCP